jgi:hypothetical protein
MVSSFCRPGALVEIAGQFNYTQELALSICPLQLRGYSAAGDRI